MCFSNSGHHYQCQLVPSFGTDKAVYCNNKNESLYLNYTLCTQFSFFAVFQMQINFQARLSIVGLRCAHKVPKS